MRALKQTEAFDVSCFSSITCWAMYFHAEKGVGGKNPELHKMVFPLWF